MFPDKVLQKLIRSKYFIQCHCNFIIGIQNCIPINDILHWLLGAGCVHDLVLPTERVIVFVKAASQIISCTGPIPILQLLHLYVWFWYVVDRMGYYTSIDQYNICQDALFQDSRRVSISALMCTMLYCTVCRYNIVLYWTDW